MTFDELTPYHGKSVTLEDIDGERYEGVAVIDDEFRDLTLYLSDGQLGLRPEEVASIEFADEA